MSTSPSYPHVLIIGGGLGGLTLAQSLRKQGISFTVFERDEEHSLRHQGWSISLHTMFDDLSSSFPPDMPSIDVTNHLHPLSLPSQIAWYDGRNPDISHRVGFTNTDDFKIMIRANRRRLRAWLRTNLSVQFDKRAVRIEETDNKVTVFFEDGTSATGDMLVGADGTHSVVRAHMTAVEPTVLPIATVVGEVTLYGKDLAAVLEMGHSGHLVRTQEGERLDMFVGINEILSDGKSGRAFWVASWPDEELTVESMRRHWTVTSSAEERLDVVRDKVRRLFAPCFQQVVSKTAKEGIRTWPLVYYALEVEPEELPRGRVTMLGDAMHCMTPFRGEGGVCAMMDALDLGRSMTRIRDSQAHGAELEKIMGEFHEIMQRRGLDSVRRSTAAYYHRRFNDPDTPRFAMGQKHGPIPRVKIEI